MSHHASPLDPHAAPAGCPRRQPTQPVAKRSGFSRFALLCASALLVLGAGLVHESHAAEASGGSVVVTLGGTLPLIVQPDPFNPFGQALSRHQANEQLRSALRAPESTLVLDLSAGFMPSLAAAEELADTLRRREPGKTVICLLENVSDPALVVAAAADRVVVAEAGLLYVSGLSFQIDHVTGLLDKMGVRFQAVTSGPQKTAPEPVTRSEPSAEALAEYQSLLDSLDQALITSSLRPGLDAQALRDARAQAPQTAALAVTHHLADDQVEPGAFLAGLPRPVRHLSAEQPLPKLDSLAGLMSFWSQLMSGPPQPRHPEVVAVVQLEGTIVDGDGDLGQGLISARATTELLKQLADDAQVVAVVLRINSGGGSAGASDRIFQAVQRLDAVKPVVALFDDAAASGGYYIALGARHIISHQATITGSIGVFALMPDLSGTRDLLGIHRTTLNSDPRADLLSTNALSEGRLAGLQHLVGAMDQRFQGLVAEHRNLPAERVAALASGRVFTGAAALEHGLVDALGSLPDAVAHARSEAGIETPLPLRVLPANGGLAALLGLGPMNALPTWLRAMAQQPTMPKVWMWRQLPALR